MFKLKTNEKKTNYYYYYILNIKIIYPIESREGKFPHYIISPMSIARSQSIRSKIFKDLIFQKKKNKFFHQNNMQHTHSST